ncbi:MAG: polynucleotide adenylyltransferase PcnB [Lentisphaerae bacterium]|nr:polynucleotide adenylyltransferase PcnB [Lentisphaerota bacterium]
MLTRDMTESPAPGKTGETARPVVRNRLEHGISRADIDPDALEVLYTLSRAGYTAYLVGGGVRDLLRGAHPKDFDVSTNAHPRAIKRLFRNCFLVGRRFRLAHIRFGQKAIETSTFRRQPEPGDDAEDAQAELLQHHDNEFGTPEEDAHRRDFTINGLFYDIRTFRVVDYVGGLQDLDRKLIRCIGNPDIRFREDPVRMVRAVRFASRLGFSIEQETWNAIRRHHSEIAKASPPRLVEEIHRLFGYGAGAAAFRLLHETGLMEDLFPELSAMLESGADAGLFWRFLDAYDAWEKKAGAFSPALAWAALSYSLFEICVTEHHRTHGIAVHDECAHTTVSQLASRLQLPKRIAFEVIHALAAQARFGSPPRGTVPPRFMLYPSFQTALDLYELVAVSTGGPLEPVAQWRRMAEQLPQHRQHDGDAPPRRSRSGRGRRRRNSRHTAIDRRPRASGNG